MAVHRISGTLQEKAIRELNEDPERIDESLQHLREWLRKQPHLNIRADDHALLTFLRGSKWSLQRTKENIDYFYTIRTLTPEFFTNRDPFCPIIQSMLQRCVFYPLPKLKDHDGPRICLFDLSAIDFGNTPWVFPFKLMLLSLDILLNEDNNLIISGVEFVADFSQIPITYMLQLTPALVKKIVLCIQEVYPIRLKHFIGINCHPLIAEFYNNVVKPFFNSKLKSRVLMFGSNETKNFFNVIPQHFLPAQYGGENGCASELAEQWKNKVESYKNWFQDDLKYATIEKLRPGKPKTYDEEFGMEGTFRKLVID